MKTTGHSISVKNATKNYGALTALNDFSIEIKPEKFTVLLGPSGSGKSTLIRSIAGIEKIDSGSIFLGESRSE
jgi:ABC-type Fe3+/spermidine/putrescine transport system ATPase subunit